MTQDHTTQPDPPNIDEMTVVEYSALKESNPECRACVTDRAVVLEKAADGKTPEVPAVPEIPPTGNPLPHPKIPVRSLGIADEAEHATEAGVDNLPDFGGLESEIGVRERSNCEESQGELEEESVVVWDAT